LIHLNLNEVDVNSLKTPVVINGIRKFNDRNGNEMAFVDIEDIECKTLSIPIFASYWKYVKSFIETNKLYLLNLYIGDRGNIIFGQQQRVDSELKIKRMVKPL
jgi:DNA polymerase III alpha subunit